MLECNGWTIFAHPCFLAQLEDLIQKVEDLRQRLPDDYKKKNATKRLAAILQLMTEKIPSDPSDAEFRQGDTLGDDNKHWFRAKFYQQYRLFFRYNADVKIIILAWVNDDETLRAYDSKTDAYKVFGRMLADGIPPGDWNELLKAAREEEERLDQVVAAIDAAGVNPR